MSDGGWDAFTEGLVTELAELTAATVIIISDRSDKLRYTQFQHFGHHIEAEVSAYTPATREPERVRPLPRDGWHSPAGADHTNWWFMLPWPAPDAGYRRLARMATTALRDVLGIVGLDQLVHTAWTHGAGPRSRELRHLPIARASA